MTSIVRDSISKIFQDHNINATVRDFIILKNKTLLTLQTPVSTEVRVGDIFDCMKKFKTFSIANKLVNELDPAGNNLITIWELME